MRLKMSITKVGQEAKKGHTVSVKVKLECGFMNERAPIFFNRKSVYICLLTERSDGYLVDFRRIRCVLVGVCTTPTHSQQCQKT